MAQMREAEGVEIEVPESSPLASVPGQGFRPIDPYDDTDFVVEGSPEADALAQPQEPPELQGKTREELLKELQTQKGDLESARAANDPVRALGQTFQELLKRQQPVAGPVQYAPQQPQETPEQRRERLNKLWLEDPVRAAEVMSMEQQRPIVDMMISNQTALSKDLAVADPEQKRVYDRWSEEVEREVQAMSPIEKAQNPRVYQTAIARVRSRHTDDIVQDLVEAAVAKKLSEMGLSPGSQPAGRPAVQTPAGQQRSLGGPGAGRKTVVVPRWVVEDADRQGLDPKFYYQHLKDKGVLR